MTFVSFKKEEIEQSIASRFEQQVRIHANRLAVKTRKHTLSYAELDRSASVIAGAVLEALGDDEVPVALLFEQGAPLIAAILASLKAGKMYVPLDPSDTRERLDFMLRDSGALLILTDEHNFDLARTLETGDRPVINSERAEPKRIADLRVARDPDRLAYIYYTSGSTGEPKGVFDSHRNILHNIMRYTNNLRICSEDRLTLLQSCTFSGSVSSLFCAILNGGAVFPIDLRKEGLNGLAQRIIDEKITVYHSVPTIFQQLMACARHLPSLRIIRLEGDPSALRHVQIYQKHFDGRCVLVNGLGATETGITRQFFMRPDTKLPGTVVPIGYATEDMETLLLDESGVELPWGDIGEIAIRSRYLARGYWRRPDLTQSAFRLCPKDPSHRIYRTGDLGRMGPDGCLEHLGRKDFQARIMGQWVAIPRIEAALSEIDGIEQAIVTAHDQESGPRLTGYVVPSSTPAPTVSAIQRALAEKLPRFMVPSTYVMLDVLPLDSNGKVDRLSLRPPVNRRPVLDAPYVAPRDEAERAVAAVWCEVLEMPEIGIHDHFLELGGNSVQAMRIMNRLGDRFGIYLSPIALFKAETVAKMAQMIGDEAMSERQKGVTHGPIQPTIRRFTPSERSRRGTT